MGLRGVSPGKEEDRMSEEKTVLIVEDEKNIVDILRFNLERKGYRTLEAYDGEEGLRKARTEKPDLILLDIMLPKMIGFDVCEALRKDGDNVPILLLTAREEEDDKVRGLEIGADDYITKPFSMREVVARVEAILRRTSVRTAEETLSAGGIELNKAAHMVMLEGEALELSFKEFELLAYFMEHEGIALSREKILNNVWNYDYFGDARTIDTHVKKLRSKLKDKGDLIKTIWGMGYKFDTSDCE